MPALLFPDRTKKELPKERAVRELTSPYLSSLLIGPACSSVHLYSVQSRLLFLSLMSFESSSIRDSCEEEKTPERRTSSSSLHKKKKFRFGGVPKILFLRLSLSSLTLSKSSFDSTPGQKLKKLHQRFGECFRKTEN